MSRRDQIRKRRYFKELCKQKLYHGCAHTLKLGDYRIDKYYDQLIKQGFDDSETWSLIDTLARWILPRLKRLKYIMKNGANETIFDGGYPAKFESSNGEEWWEIMDKMIYAFESTVNPPWFDLTKDGKLSEEELEHEKKVQEGFELFGKYLAHLWW